MPNHEEAGVVSALVDLCKRLDIRCLLQVGAEDGYEAEQVRLATGCRAVCFDPDPKAKVCSAALEWHPIVIGATDSMTTFFVHSTSGLSSTLRRGEGNEEAHEMRMWRLDTFCAAYSIKPDALIVDTEGSGLDVLEGAGDLLDDVKLIYAELQNAVIRPGVRLRPEVESFLSVRGFTQHSELPTYDAGGQGNFTYVRIQ